MVIGYITKYSQSRAIASASLVQGKADDMEDQGAIKHNPTSDPLRILCLSGSLRSASFSTSILRAMSYVQHPGLRLSVRTLEDIPLYNEDLDAEPAVTAVAKLREQVLESDGIVIATPEYNHGMPGVLKNALDWASRPAFASCFREKPVLIITSAPGPTGGVRAQYQVRETLVSMLAKVVPGREILLPGAENRVCESRFTDADTSRILARGLQALRKEVISSQGTQGVSA